MSRAFFSGFIKKKKPFFHAGQAAYAVRVSDFIDEYFSVSGLSRFQHFLRRFHDLINGDLAD
jgi:hypothetical protein